MKGCKVQWVLGGGEMGVVGWGGGASKGRKGGGVGAAMLETVI